MFSRLLLICFLLPAAAAGPWSSFLSFLGARSIRSRTSRSATDALQGLPPVVWAENILPGVSLPGLVALKQTSITLRPLAHTRAERYQWSRQRALDLIRTILHKLPELANDTLTAEDPATAFQNSLAQLVRDADSCSSGNSVFADFVKLTGTFTPAVKSDVFSVHRWRVVFDVDGSLNPYVARWGRNFSVGKDYCTQWEETRREEDSDLSRVTLEDVQELIRALEAESSGAAPPLFRGGLLDRFQKMRLVESVGKVFINLEMDPKTRKFVCPIPVRVKVLLDGRARVRDRCHREVDVRGNSFDIDDEDRVVKPLRLC